MNLGEETDYSATITEIKGKITIIKSLATTAAFNAVENKIPNFSDLVKKNLTMQKYHTLALNMLLQPI